MSLKMKLLFAVVWVVLPLSSGQEEDLVFLVVGDWGDSFYWEEDDPQNVVARGMNEWAALYNPKFILSTGDNFYPDGVRSVNDAWFEQKWKQVYTGESIKDLQWRLSLGNHDYDPKDDRPGPNDGGNEMFQVYRSETDPQWYMPYLWYKFTESSPAGDVDFFIVDTEAIRSELNNYTEHIQWIEDELAASEAAVKLVVGHLNVFTLGNRAPGDEAMQQILEPIMRANNIDAYISGHDHAMQHFAYANGTGHDYIISAGGGRGLYSENLEWTERFEEMGINTEYRESYGFAGVFINATTMLCNMYDQDARFLFDIIRPIGQSRLDIS